ncbi:metalloprotease [Coprinopsis cinerea okayama7|uniref:Metalloprotease n=1 Tax=Coprinopsis cinerea (strain Okayama-7 / 130 / ATCC MYA-4618 / FGSC 9003) TaxID=240176 RepID=A8P0W4_COPC7|nr:metalloprotease [Coprinopsis cinerea okayama7\|eukprot:XP_001837981.2 metalloprotease [Coprinopsis cinerea okayama7\
MRSMTTLVCSALALLFVSSSITSVTAAPQFRSELRHRRVCGTHISSSRRTAAEKYFQTHRVPAADPDATATLDVYFHIVHANKTSEGGYVTDEQIEEQMEIMNKSYEPTGLSWNLVNVTRIKSPEWFAAVSPGSKDEIQMKKTFRYGNASALNIWTVGFREGEGAGLLGYATFPSDYKDEPEVDGVVLLYSTMPGGSSAPYDKGMTLVHEVGHWGGLYHTFEGGCSGKGDYVDDTPKQREAVYGCPKPIASCPGGQKALVKNFMNYSDDDCMDSFTEGQITRLRTQVRSFRGVSV